MASVNFVQNMRDDKVMENNVDQIHAVNYKNLLSMDHVKTVRNIIDNKIQRLAAQTFVPIQLDREISWMDHARPVQNSQCQKKELIVIIQNVFVEEIIVLILKNNLRMEPVKNVHLKKS
jgi:hypothetical protein